MSFMNYLTNEKCPHCKKTLETTKSNVLFGVIIKACPDNHFQKEFHPALETYIESNTVS